MLLSISRTSTGNNFYFCSICNITFILLKVKVWNIISYFFHIRACLKNHSRNLHAPLCGIFCLNSVAVARYGAFIRTKSPTNCDAHLAESLFQTRSRLFQTGFRVFSRLLFTGNIPRGVFCEQSSQKTRELRREIMRMHDFCASRSELLVTE